MYRKNAYDQRLYSGETVSMFLDNDGAHIWGMFDDEPHWGANTKVDKGEHAPVEKVLRFSRQNNALVAFDPPVFFAGLCGPGTIDGQPLPLDLTAFGFTAAHTNAHYPENMRTLKRIPEVSQPDSSLGTSYVQLCSEDCALPESIAVSCGPLTLDANRKAWYALRTQHAVVRGQQMCDQPGSYLPVRVRLAPGVVVASIAAQKGFCLLLDTCGRVWVIHRGSEFVQVSTQTPSSGTSTTTSTTTALDDDDSGAFVVQQSGPLALFVQAVPVGGLRDIARIFSSLGEFCIVMDNQRRLWGFGENCCGELGCIPDRHRGVSCPITDPVQIPVPFDPKWVACGKHYTCILDQEGRLWGMGRLRPEPDDTVEPCHAPHSLCECDFCKHTLNTPTCLSHGTQEDASTIVPLPVMISCSAGADHALALDDQRQLWVWGNNRSVRFFEKQSDHPPCRAADPVLTFATSAVHVAHVAHVAALASAALASSACSISSFRSILLRGIFPYPDPVATGIYLECYDVTHNKSAASAIHPVAVDADADAPGTTITDSVPISGGGAVVVDQDADPGVDADKMSGAPSDHCGVLCKRREPPTETKDDTRATIDNLDPLSTMLPCDTGREESKSDQGRPAMPKRPRPNED